MSKLSKLLGLAMSAAIVGAGLVPLMAAPPLILATLRCVGEDPALLHLVGKGFGLAKEQVTLWHGGTMVTSLCLLNDSHIIFSPPGPVPSDLWITLEVQGQATRFPLTLAPFQVAADPGQLLLEAPEALGQSFNACLRKAFGLPAEVEGAAPMELDSPDLGPARAFPAAGISAPPPLALDPLQPQAPRGDTMCLNAAASTVSVNGAAAVVLPQSNYKILEVLAGLPGKREDKLRLGQQLYNGSKSYQSMILAANIYALRQKLERDPKHPRYLTTTPTGAYQLNLWDLSPGARNLPGAEDPSLDTLSLDLTTLRVTLGQRTAQLSKDQYTLVSLIAHCPGKAAKTAWLLAQPLLASASNPDKRLKNLVGGIRRCLETDSNQLPFLVAERNINGSGHKGYRLRAKDL